MGILDDLSMGLGLKDRDDDYYERTARTLGRTQGKAREAQYRRSRGFGQLGRQGLLSGSGMGGYRDTRDMFDGGGPMARGGRYEGGGLISFLANLANAVAGRDMGERVGYGATTETTMKRKAKIMPTSTYDAERMMRINDPLGSSLLARNDNPSVSAMGYGIANAPANKVAVAPSISNTAKTTEGQDLLYEIATDVVVKRMSPEGFQMMPPEERRALIDEEYTKIVSAIGLQ